MNLLAVSDLHLSAGSGERNALFIEFLQDALSAGDEVLIIGDLFDLWFGREALIFPFQRSIVARMKELASEGLQIDYVEGNRDFFLSRYSGSVFRTVSSGGFHRDWGSRRLYAEHGDWINTDDKQYRLFKRATKNRLSAFLMDHLPAGFLMKQAEAVERKMKSTNMKYRTGYPERHCRRFAEKKGRAGADLVIIGHFHEEKMWEMQMPDRTVLFYNLPGWENGFRYLVIPESSQKPYFKDKERKDHGDIAAS